MIDFSGAVTAYLVYVTILFISFFLAGFFIVLLSLAIATKFYLKKKGLFRKKLAVFLIFAVIGGFAGDILLIQWNRIQRNTFIKQTKEFHSKMEKSYNLVDVRLNFKNKNLIDVVFTTPRTDVYKVVIIGETKDREGMRRTAFSSSHHKVQLKKGENILNVGNENVLSSYETIPLNSLDEVDLIFMIKPLNAQDYLDNTPKTPYFKGTFVSSTEGINYSSPKISGCRSDQLFQVHVVCKSSDLLHVELP